MNKCLIICPTYGRPDQYRDMVMSFYDKSICSDMLTLTKEGSITTLVNNVNFSNYEYVGITNDDVIYHTHGWDRIIVETIERKGIGFAFGNDGTRNNQLPALCVMSSCIPKTLGWIQYPHLNHLYGDMVWQYLGKRLNRLYYVPDVYIEHRHFLFGKGKKEDYERTNSKELYKADNAIFNEWLKKDAEDCVSKLKLELDM